MLPELVSNPTEIVLIGAGVSLDYANPTEYSRQASRVVVGLNNVTSLIPCDYVILTDKIALLEWGKNAEGPNQYAVAPKGMYHKYRIGQKWPNSRWLQAENHFSGPPFVNARTVACCLVRQLVRQCRSIQRLTYIGMDSGTIREFNGKQALTLWQYAACLKPFALNPVHEKRFFAGNPGNRYRFELARPYKNYFPLVQDCFVRNPDIRSRLHCRSFVDWSKLTDSQMGFSRIINKNLANKGQGFTLKWL